MKNALFWLLAFVITVSSAIYQRMTGPTYPVRGRVTIENSEVKFRLKRTHGGETDHRVEVKVNDSEVTGVLKWKRYKTTDEWATVQMQREDVVLAAMLPNQPPAGKLQYKVLVTKNEKEISLSSEEPIIIRFKGSVPAGVLVPHIIFMFAAMLFSTQAAIEALRPSRNPRKLAIWTLGLLAVGGMILGPVVQQYAFGALWTGFPFGTDLTDNKTLIAFIGWIIAVIAGRGGKPARGWVIAAFVILMTIYLIPHSMMGSELDYSQLDAPQ